MLVLNFTNNCEALYAKVPWGLTKNVALCWEPSYRYEKRVYDFPVVNTDSIREENGAIHRKLEGDIKAFRYKTPIEEIHVGEYFEIGPKSYYRPYGYKITNKVTKHGDRWLVCRYFSKEKDFANPYLENAYVYAGIGEFLYYSQRPFGHEPTEDEIQEAPLQRGDRGKPCTIITSAPPYRNWIQGVVNACTRLEPYVSESEIWAGLSDQCAANAQYIDCNTPMLIKEIANLKNSTESVVALMRGKWNTKTLADLYLSTKYGARLTIKDARELLNKVTDYAFGHEDPGRVHSRYKLSIPATSTIPAWQYEYYLTVDYLQWPGYTLEGAFTRASNWDLVFSLQNIWDFIPYSFVVDWFVDVEAALKRIDNRTYWQALKVVDTIMTTKRETDVEISRFIPQYSGSVHFTDYIRNVGTKVPTGAPRLNPSFESINHVPELTALFRQRIR